MPTLLTSTAITAIQLKESASPGTPSAGYGRLYYYTDNTLHIIDDAGADVNLTGLYTGGLALTSQAAGDVITASSTTQLSRVAKGTAYQVFHMNSGATAPEWTSTLGVTGTRLTAGFFTDLTVTNAIAGSVTGTAATVTGATQASITSAANLATVGTITSGIWNAGAVTSSGDITTSAGKASITKADDALVYLSATGASANQGAVYVRRGGGNGMKFAVETDGWAWLNGAGASAGGGAGTSRMALSDAGVLTVSGFGTHTFSAGGTGFNSVGTTNPTAGTGNGARLHADSDAGTLFLSAFSSTFTTSAQDVQAGAKVQWDAAGGLSIAATHASGAIRFYSGGTTLRWTIGTDGGLTGSYLYATSSVYIGTADAPHGFSVSSSGASSSTIYIGNASINVTSDRRLKANIIDTAIDATSLLSRLTVRDFTWNDPSDTSFNNRNARGRWTGLIAQEVVGIMPWVVNAPRREADLSIDYDDPSPWHIEYGHIVPVLVSGWQQHDRLLSGDGGVLDELSALRARVAELEARVN